MAKMKKITKITMKMNKFIFFNIISSVSALSQSNENYLSNMLSFYESIIDKSYEAIDEDFSQGTDICTLNQACKSTGNFGVYSETGYSIDLQFNNISTNRDEIIFKKSISGYNATTETKETLCVVNDQKELWKETLEDNPTGIKWQYVGITTGDYGLYPAVNWSETNQCFGSTYNPTIRPWYTVAQTGAKDIIIVIDLSDHLDNSEERLEMSKVLAKKFLSSLSFVDYFGIIVYSTFTVAYDDTYLYRASSEDIADAEEFIDGLVLDSDSTTNIGLVIDDAIDIFDLSSDSGYSSGCIKTIVLISSGGNGIHDVNPVNLLKNTNIKVFSYVLSPGEHDPAEIVPSKLACETKGIIQTITNYSSIDYAVESYGTYLAAGILNEKISWSEIYEDAFGQGRVVTGGYQIRVDGEFKGIFAMDVTVSNITQNNNITEDELISHLVETQMCASFIYDDIVEAKQIELMGSDVCHNLSSDNDKEEEWWITHLWFFVILMLFVCFILALCLPVYTNINSDLNYKDEDYNDKKFHQECSTICSIGSILMWLWFLLCFWILLWPEIVIVNTYKMTEITVETKAVNGYQCANKVNCQCSNTNADKSCSNMKKNLVEGKCDDGYYCCNWEYYECNCYSDSKGNRHCSTCSYCDKSVSHQKCEIKVGTCYNPTVIGSFDVGNDIVETSFSKKCYRDDLDCANKYLDSFPVIGEHFNGYYNTADVSDVELTIGYSDYALGLTLFPATWIFITLCYALYVLRLNKKIKKPVTPVVKKPKVPYDRNIQRYREETL